MESIVASEVVRDKDIEELAEEELEQILKDPENQFLNEHQQNRDRIENALTGREALSIAKGLIALRLKETMVFRASQKIEGVQIGEVSSVEVIHQINDIRAGSEMIGSGKDGVVVIDRNELPGLPEEVCYKFERLIEEEVRGRNLMRKELQMQEDIYSLVSSMKDNVIGVPVPFYYVEIGVDKMIAMERLPARSINHILAGAGNLPEWINIEKLCEDLGKVLTEMHKNGIYHRDLHLGNVMINQSTTEPADGKWGYLIDFGLSSYMLGEEDPYRSELPNGDAYLHKVDDVVLKKMDMALSRLREINQRN